MAWVRLAQAPQTPVDFLSNLSHRCILSVYDPLRIGVFDLSIHLHLQVRMSFCISFPMYLYECMDVFSYVWMSSRMYVFWFVCMCVFLYANTHKRRQSTWLSHATGGSLACSVGSFCIQIYPLLYLAIDSVSGWLASQLARYMTHPSIPRVFWALCLPFLPLRSLARF